MVAITTLTSTLALVASVLALPNPNPSPLTPDPAGDKNVGNGQGGQFITGACLSDADCASGCCAVLGSGGICSGTAVSFAQGKQGCGFKGAAAAAPAAAPAAAAPAAGNSGATTGSTLTPDPAGAKNVGNGQGGQFITGACLSDADCASGCCAVLGSGGICSGTAVSFAQGKQGCGFKGAAAAAPAAAPAAAAPAVGNSGATTGSTLTPDPAGAKNVGNGQGGQFITGACLSDADCASGCCAVLGSGGICSGTAVSFAQGKQGCGFKGTA